MTDILKLLGKLALFIPIVITIVVVNYFVDPANLYGQKKINATGKTYEEQVANYLAAGYNVANVSTLDERLLQKYFIEALPKGKEFDLVILGSSRCQLIGADLYPDKKLLNNGVTGATLEDIASILNIHDSTGTNVKEVLVELSPWYLNGENGQSRWKSIEGDFTSFKKKIAGGKEVEPSHDLLPSIDPKTRELFSLSYFQQSIKSIRQSGSSEGSKNTFQRTDFQDPFTIAAFYKQVSPLLDITEVLHEDTLTVINKLLDDRDLKTRIDKILPGQEYPEEIALTYLDFTQTSDGVDDVQRENFRMLNRKLLEVAFYETCPPSEDALSYPTFSKNNSGLTRIADGTLSYPRSFREQSEEEVKAAVRSFLTTPVFGLQDFNEISNEKLTLLKDLLRYLAKKKIAVKIAIVPYHPDVYNALTTDRKYSVALSTEGVFKQLAQEFQVPINGSYNPEKCQLTAADFYDAMHPKEYAYKKILATEVPSIIP